MSHGVADYVYGYSTILALPIFQDTILAMLAGLLVAIVVSAAVTFLLGFDESIVVEEEETPETPVPAADPVPEKPNSLLEIYAPLMGTVTPCEQIPDETFVTSVLGDGVGMELEIGEEIAAFDGEISSTTDISHAVGVSGPDGMKFLIHVGVDTVRMKGKSFTLLAQEGNKVQKGQKLIVFDIAKIKAAGHSATTAVGGLFYRVLNEHGTHKGQGNSCVSLPLVI